MNGKLASSLGMTLGLLAAPGYAQEAAWRAAKPRDPKPPAAAPQPAPPVAATPPAPDVAPSNRMTADPPVAAAEPAPARHDPAVIQAAAGPADRIDPGPWVKARAKYAADDPPDPIRQLPATVATPAPAAAAAAPAAPAACVPVTVHPGTYPSYLTGANPFAAEATAARAPRFQVSAEYLLWWVKSSSIPPLLTTSPPNGPNNVPGALPGSVVLLADKDLDEQVRHGARFGAVWWLDECASYGFDSRYFFTGEVRERFAATSDQFPNGLFRPFFAINPPSPPLAPFFPAPFSEQVTGPGVSSGTFVAENRSQFWGAEVNWRDNCYCWHECSCCGGGRSLRADLLAGFRYLNLDESLNITESYVLLAPDAVNNPPGTSVTILDRFATENEFYGGQIGAVVEYRRDRWSLDLRTTVALGVTNQRLTIEGGQLRTPPGGPTQQYLGGLLALNSNIGTRERDEFSVVPEIGVNVGYQVTDGLRAFVGYNFLYWSNVIRPGDQIDPVLDVTRIPVFIPPGVMVAPANEVRPAPLFRETDFWAQGLNAGLEFRW
jgi:hypothetical protein